MKSLLTLLLLSTLFSACRKEVLLNPCSLLQQGIAANNPAAVEAAVESIIQSLPSQAYTQENFNRFVGKLSSCGLQILGDCFDCIKTLPSQSEVWLSVNASGTAVRKTIDITYTPNNEMTYRGMHD